MNDRAQSPNAATPGLSFRSALQVRVTRGQHGGEARHFFFAAAFFAGLLVAAAHAHIFQGAFAVNFLLQTAQGFIHWLAFFQFNLGQSNSLPLRGAVGGQPGAQNRVARLELFRRRVNLQKTALGKAEIWPNRPICGELGRSQKRKEATDVSIRCLAEGFICLLAEQG